MPSVKLALDHVNEHSDILTNYRLHMWWNDTQVNLFLLSFHLFFFFIEQINEIIYVFFSSAMRLLVLNHFSI